ncbi:MAG: hypothetical protein ACLPV8_15580 [Steroidobacteraceae bacterium]
MIAPRLLALAACAVPALIAQRSMADPEAGLDWREPWVQPHDAGAAASVSDEYAWRLFVAVNWPADTLARAADPTAKLGAERPTVWETWQNTADVYRGDGSDPGPWVRRAAVPAIADPRRFETFSLKDLPNVRHIVGGRMVPLVDPVSSAKRLTEIRMNRPAFEYIRARELYNLDGQLRILAERRAVHFPAGATEVKAKWRPIRADEQSHYHCVQVRLADGTPRLYGLTALHIVTKDLPQWYWATFEQVDNPSLADADGWQLPSSDRFACGGGKPDCNRAPAGIGLEGTVWQFYRLRGTLTRFVDARGQPLRLANSELEAGIQPTASCITCHARSSIGLVAGSPVRLSIFDTRIDTAADDPIVRRGFLGLPQAAWFEGAREDGGSRPLFRPLDFVWSLSKAQPKRGS